MKALVIVGECIQVNSSANLCHLAYLRGLVDAGVDVTLLSSDPKGYETDEGMMIPGEIESYTFYSVTLYEKISLLFEKGRTAGKTDSHSAASHQAPVKKTGGRMAKAKKRVLSLYGPYGIYSKFLAKAFRFRSDKQYDVVISLSTPPASHLLAYKLLTSGHVKSKHWIQIWEDPWSGDVFCRERKQEAYGEEKRLLTYADRICYVSPITLEYQKKMFPEAAQKMYWVPLPAYYSEECSVSSETEEKVFGYFGDYRKPARDLEPFYHAAKAEGVLTNICGRSDLKLSSAETIRVYPRLDLNELRPIEQATDVLVFLCNCKGGQIPGKIYQYAATHKTILFILDGTEDEKAMLRSFFAPFNRFVFCENRVDSIREAIRAICRGELGAVQNIPLTQFQPREIIQRILDEGMK